MAATLTQRRFTGPNWVFEQKFDGIRLLAFKNGREVRLLSRNRLLQNSAYPSIVDAVSRLAMHDVILDGEATGVWGRRGEVTYHVFDVLWFEGRDITRLALDARHEILLGLTLPRPLVHVERLEQSQPWEYACEQGWEGVIAKRRDASYEHRRSPHWLKMKCEASQELVVGGFTEPRGSRQGVGALLVGYFDDGEFVFAGKVGTGFDTATLLSLRERFTPLEVPEPPFERGSGLPRQAHWLRPEVVIQVAFTEWTVHGKLRHPRFLGLRDDKRARDVVRETP